MKHRMILDAIIDRVAGDRELTVQERLQDLIENKGLNQYELSVLLGVSESTLSRWIRGERIPRGMQTQRLLDFIELELERNL